MSNNPDGVHIATKTAHVTVDGHRTIIREGVTRVREGHALLDAYPGFFQPVGEGVRFDVETTREEPSAPPAPAKKAPAKKAAASDGNGGE